MGKVKDFRLFVAEEIVRRNKVIDLDKAFVIADQLWYDATVKKSKKAQAKIGRYVKKYRGG